MRSLSLSVPLLLPKLTCLLRSPPILASSNLPTIPMPNTCATRVDFGNFDFIHLLPDEILAEIFAEGRPTIEVIPHISIPHGRVRKYAECPLFAMMGVCRRWRSVIVSTPASWSRFYFNPLFSDRWLPTLPFCPSQAFQKFLAMCLTRSADHPLDLSIGSVPSFEMLLGLIATSNRWRKVVINFENLSKVAKSEAYNGFPALRYLELYPGLSDPLARAHEEPPIVITVDAPRLLAFQASHGFDYFPFQMTIPNVTHVHLFIHLLHRLAEIMGLLSGLQHLSHLSLESKIDGVGGGPTDSSLVSWALNLPRLEKLALQLGPSVTWSILSRARLPSLKHLRIEMLMPSVRRNRASFAHIERDFDLFLSHCPQLESFVTQSVNFTKFKKILLATQPRYAAFAHDGQPLTNFEVQSLLRDLILGSDNMKRVEEFALFDGGKYEIDQASVFIDTVVSQCLAMAHETPGNADPRALHRIDVHSPAPIREQQLERKLQELHRRGLIPSATEIHLHYSNNRSKNGCRLAVNKWSSSTGPVTTEWDTTFYPFAFGV